MFILKVYDIAHGDQFVQWSDDGTTFWVTDIERFSQDILPKYFKHNNYTSFVRQLSSYGFRRCAELGRTIGSREFVERFTNPFFQRGRRDLLKNIHRKSRTTSSAQAPARPKRRLKGEPNDEEEEEDDDAFTTPGASDQLERLRSRCELLEEQVTTLMCREKHTCHQLASQATVMHVLLDVVSRMALNIPNNLSTFAQGSSSPMQSSFAYGYYLGQMVPSYICHASSQSQPYVTSPQSIPGQHSVSSKPQPEAHQPPEWSHSTNSSRVPDQSMPPPLLDTSTMTLNTAQPSTLPTSPFHQTDGSSLGSDHSENLHISNPLREVEQAHCEGSNMAD